MEIKHPSDFFPPLITYEGNRTYERLERGGETALLSLTNRRYVSNEKSRRKHYKKKS